jgi:hypothetical protein
VTITRDLVLTVLLSVALAAWITDHVALAVALLRRKPRWRGPVAFVVVPLAPVFGFMEKLRVRSALWLLLAIAYGVLRWKASA